MQSSRGMAKEVSSFYLHSQYVQPPIDNYYNYEYPNGPTTSSAPPFEMTAGPGTEVGSGSASVRSAPLVSTQISQHVSPHHHSRRKIKLQQTSTNRDYDDDADDSRSSRSAPDKKQNHSEIEKRRRDKMNTYISELSSMIPMCGAMARKLDKLTVLRMAVQHLRTIGGALTSSPLKLRPHPTFLSKKELNELVLHAAQDCFLLVVGCARGRLLYVSSSVRGILHYEQSELLGQSLFDIIHPKDVNKVKEQLSSDLGPRERLIDAKTMLPVKADVAAGASRFCPGARRSFFCHIKCKSNLTDTEQVVNLKQEGQQSTTNRKKPSQEKKYCVVQCTGYLKSSASLDLPNSKTSNTSEGGEDGEACNGSCLVAVGRVLPDVNPTAPQPSPVTRRLQFISRHGTDGKFLFVDQRVTLALGFLPQELLGTSLYEYVMGSELDAVAHTHKTALLRRGPMETVPYSFRKKDGSYIVLQTMFKPFRNPWTKDVEYIVASNTIVPEDSRYNSKNSTCSTMPVQDVYTQKCDMEVQRMIDCQVESHKIGSAIAEEVLRRCSPEFSPELLRDNLYNLQQPSLMDTMFVDGYDQVRNNVPLSAARVESPPQPNEEPPTMPIDASPPLGIDGNGEATMAVIMSLLEANAGLGGQINYSGLPWPLP